MTALAALAAGYAVAVPLLLPFVRPGRHRRHPIRITPSTPYRPETRADRYTLAA